MYNSNQHIAYYTSFYSARTVDDFVSTLVSFFYRVSFLSLTTRRVLQAPSPVSAWRNPIFSSTRNDITPTMHSHGHARNIQASSFWLELDAWCASDDLATLFPALFIHARVQDISVHDLIGQGLPSSFHPRTPLPLIVKLAVWDPTHRRPWCATLLGCRPRWTSPNEYHLLLVVGWERLSQPTVKLFWVMQLRPR